MIHQKRKKHSKPAKKKTDLLGVRLLKAGLITKEQLDCALQKQSGNSELLGDVLVRLGYLKEKQLKRFLNGKEEKYHLVPLDLAELDSPMLMEFYQLQSQIKFALFSDSPLKSILITSSLSGEGKTLCSSYMAIITAVTLGKKVLLIDADLRHPSLHKIFHLPNVQGLTDVLVDSCSISQAIQPTKLPNLRVLTTGTRASNPPQLLSSTTMERVLQELSQQFDLLFIDSPPALVTPEAALLSALTQGLILVVEAGKSRMKEVQRTVAKLRQAKANILGVLLNQYSNDELDNYRYKYYFSNNDNDYR